MFQESLVLLTDDSCTLSSLTPPSPRLPRCPSSLLTLPPPHSHAQFSALIGPCSGGCHSPANRLSGACSLSNPKEGVSQRATPWLLLANSGHLLRPPASEGKGQTRAARHSGVGEGVGGAGGVRERRGRVPEVEGWGRPCWNGINNIINDKIYLHFASMFQTFKWCLKEEMYGFCFCDTKMSVLSVFSRLFVKWLTWVEWFFRKN